MLQFRTIAWVVLAAVVTLVLDTIPQSVAQNKTSPFVDTNSTAPSSSSDANPFSEADGTKICCCQVANTSSYTAYQYQDPSTAPPQCCCGTPGEDCPDVCASTSFSSVCGSGQVCGILLLMAALVGTLAITICITGVFLARRRRQRSNTEQFFVASSSQAGQGVPQQVSIVRVPDEQLKDLEIKDKVLDDDSSLAERSTTDEEQGSVSQTECPICLEPVEGVVSEFPCGHTCCRGCRDDLVLHSSRVVNASTVAILCPLCRKLAVAPSPSGGIGSRGSRQQVILIQSVVDERRAEAEADEEALTMNENDGDRVENDSSAPHGSDEAVDAVPDSQQQAAGSGLTRGNQLSSS